MQHLESLQNQLQQMQAAQQVSVSLNPNPYQLLQGRPPRQQWVQFQVAPFSPLRRGHL